MRRILVALVAAAVLVGGAPVAGTAAPAVTKAQAIAIVKRILERNAEACELQVRSLAARKVAVGWRVTAKVSTFGYPGTAAWVVRGKKATPADPLAAEIAIGCP